MHVVDKRSLVVINPHGATYETSALTTSGIPLLFLSILNQNMVSAYKIGKRNFSTPSLPFYIIKLADQKSTTNHKYRFTVINKSMY